MNKETTEQGRGELPVKQRCPYELFVIKYFGIPDNTFDRKVQLTYADIVNALCMFTEESTPSPVVHKSVPGEAEHELKRRVAIILSEPNGLLRNSMIENITIDLFDTPSPANTSEQETVVDIWQEVIASVRLYENNVQGFDEFVKQLQSTYKISKR